MLANKVLRVVLLIIGLPVLLCQLLLTLVLGIVNALTLGLLGFLLTIIWNVFLFVLVGLTFIGSKHPILREMIGFAFMPIAIVAHTYACIKPAFGDVDHRIITQRACDLWPYTYEFHQWARGNLLDSTSERDLRTFFFLLRESESKRLPRAH